VDQLFAISSCSPLAISSCSRTLPMNLSLQLCNTLAVLRNNQSRHWKGLAFLNGNRHARLTASMKPEQCGQKNLKINLLWPTKVQLVDSNRGAWSEKTVAEDFGVDAMRPNQLRQTPYQFAPASASELSRSLLQGRSQTPCMLYFQCTRRQKNCKSSTPRD
jgi:hypothetical protein